MDFEDRVPKVSAHILPGEFPLGKNPAAHHRIHILPYRFTFGCDLEQMAHNPGTDQGVPVRQPVRP